MRDAPNNEERGSGSGQSAAGAHPRPNAQPRRRVFHAAVQLVCVVALCLSAARLASVDRYLLRHRRWAKNEWRLEPALGAFRGIGEGGYIEQAGPGHGSRLLLFIVHSSRAAADVDYWNRVVAALERTEEASKDGVSYWYWGVCDEGAACNSYQTKANFRVVGFMEPYEMRIAAMLDAAHQVAVYGEDSSLVATIPLLPRPSDEAEAVLREAH